MNIRPTIEFDNKYINAKNKLIDFMGALNDLTEAQRYQLAREYIASAGMTALFEQFVSYVNYINNEGQI